MFRSHSTRPSPGGGGRLSQRLIIEARIVWGTQQEQVGPNELRPIKVGQD